MSDDYVSREVFDETVKRYEVMLEACEARIQKHIAKLDAQFRIQNIKNKKIIDELALRLNDNRSHSDRLLTILGVCFTAASVIFAGVSLYISVIAPAVAKLGGVMP